MATLIGGMHLRQQRRDGDDGDAAEQQDRVRGQVADEVVGHALEVGHLQCAFASVVGLLLTTSAQRGGLSVFRAPHRVPLNYLRRPVVALLGCDSQALARDAMAVRDMLHRRDASVD